MGTEFFQWEKMGNKMGNNVNLEELENLANSGDVGAIFEVGKIYFEGNGVETNYGKAKYYLEVASERGSQKANYYLGKMRKEEFFIANQ